MDPLSLTDSIIVILGFTKNIINYLKGVHSFPQDQIDIFRELKGLECLLTTLKHTVQNAKPGDPWFSAICALGVQHGPLDQF